MRDQVYELQGILGNGDCDLQAFGRVLDEGWQLKRQLASTITTDQIDIWYRRGRDAGAWGGKLCGAGGGGFLLFVVPLAAQAAVRQALGNLQEVSMGPEAHGSQILFAE